MPKPEAQGDQPLIEFFFDCSSPWTWLGFESIQPLAEELAVPIQWKPILVGGVFNAVNGSVYEARKNPASPKMRHLPKDLADWARLQGLKINFPPSVFPVNSVKAMRACCWLGQDCVPFARAAFSAYWTDDRDISQDLELAAIARDCGLDPELFAAIATDAVKAMLRSNTEELIARGGFGSPTIFVGGDDMYFGNDRMPLIRAALERAQG
jgi:2-hydroxychromene-2-carboxylate isomerase